MRALAGLLVALAVVASGCGDKKQAAPLTTKASAPSPDRGKAEIDAFVAATGRGDANATWALLSRPSRQRLGPFSRFRRTTAIELSEGVGSFARSRYEVVVSERVTEDFGAVAIAGVREVEGTREYDAYGTALRLENAQWRIELGGPIEIQPLGPAPGARERSVVQIGAEIVARFGGLATAVAWLDGVTLDAQVRGTSTSATLFANLASALARGRHDVLVLAVGEKDASATAWTFSVR